MKVVCLGGGEVVKAEYETAMARNVSVTFHWQVKGLITLFRVRTTYYQYRSQVAHRAHARLWT